MKKTRAYEDALVVKNWKLPEIYEQYHKKLKAYTQSMSKGTKEFISIMQMTKVYGIERIKKILKDLDDKNRYSYEEVLSVLRYQEDLPSKTTLKLSTLAALGVEHIKSSHTPLVQYDALMKEVKVMNKELVEKLAYCKLSGVSKSFERIYKESIDKKATPLEFFEALLDEEIISRENSRYF